MDTTPDFVILNSGLEIIVFVVTPLFVCAAFCLVMLYGIFALVEDITRRMRDEQRHTQEVTHLSPTETEI